MFPQEGFDEDDNEVRTGFSLLVAGYGLATAPGQAEVWTATVPTRGMPPQLSAEPVTVCGRDKESHALIYELFDSYCEDLDAERVDR